MLFIVLLVLLLAVAAGIVIRNRGLRGALLATSLRWVGLGLVLAGTAIALPRLLAEHNPTWLIVFLGTASVVLAGTPLVVPRGRPQVVMTWICSLALIALAAVFGLGGGAFMLPGALVLLFAAGAALPGHGRPEAG